MMRSTFTGFSPKQQIVFAICCLGYGLYLGETSWRLTRQTLVTFPLAEPVSAEVRFLIDPPVDLNTAGYEELQLLPSVGPILAERILTYRAQHGPFTALEELEHVHGIGPKTVARFRSYSIIQPD